MRLAGLEPATYRLGGGRSVQTELQAQILFRLFGYQEIRKPAIGGYGY